MSKYGVFPGLYFPVFGMNTEIYRVNLHVQSKYGKIRTRKNSVFRHFLRSESGVTFIQKLTPGFKNHMRNFGNFRQAVESLKSQFFSKFVSFFSIMRDHSSVMFYITETLYTNDKSSTSKCKFSDLPLFALKFTKFFRSCMEPRVSFSSNFAPLFSVMRYNSSVIFHLNFYMLWTKETIQSANFQTFDSSHEN